MAAENEAIAAWIVLHGILEQERQLKARSLPRYPRDLTPKLAIKLLQLRFSVGAGRQRDRPVGMQMVHMGKRKERVQRRIDRSRHPILAECGQWIAAHHFVFMRLAAVELLQLFQPIEIE